MASRNGTVKRSPDRHRSDVAAAFLSVIVSVSCCTLSSLLHNSSRWSSRLLHNSFLLVFKINGVLLSFGWLSEKMPHAVPVYMRPSNKDRLYIALYARGGDSIMSGGEDK